MSDLEIVWAFGCANVAVPLCPDRWRTEILEYIEVLTAAIEDFRSKVNQMHNRLKGEFNIGIINNLVTMPRGYITNTLTQLAEEHAGVIINISMSTLSDIECRVLDNRLHAGVIPLLRLCPV